MGVYHGLVQAPASSPAGRSLPLRTGAESSLASQSEIHDLRGRGGVITDGSAVWGPGTVGQGMSQLS